MDVLDEGASTGQQVLTPTGISYLRRTYPWIRFLGILGIIAGVMYMLMAFFAGSILGMAGAGVGNQFAGFGAVVGIMYFVIGGVVTYISYLLFGYGTKLKAGLTTNDSGQFERALKDQKNYFHISGILALIALAFAVLGLFGGIIGGMAASSM